MKPKDAAALILLAAVWGGSFLFIRMAVPSLGPLPLVAIRVVLAALVLAAVLVALRRPVELKRHARGLLVLGAMNAAIPFTLISWAELHLSAALASTLNATVPLFTALLSVVWLGERLTPARVGGLLLGVAGVAVLVGWSPLQLTAATVLSVLAMLGATLSYAFAGVYTKRSLSGVSTWTLALGQQLGAAAWLAGPAAIQWPSARPPIAAVGAVFALGVLSTALAYVLYFRLISSMGPTRTGTVTYIVPLFGMAWGTLFLGEPVTGGMFAGLACILVSMLLVNEVKLGRLMTFGRRAARYAVLHQRAVLEPAGRECTTC
ncbi:MAG TPA: DMT family transporter [Longimicrobium sp.]|nr:DMT family transporter [Longimicrobium sp.]